MKIRICSDLHLEFHNLKKDSSEEIDALIPRLEGDKDTVLVIPGDMGTLGRAETWLHPLKYLSTRFKAVVYVMGNHSFYSCNYFNRIDILQREVKLPKNVHFLENQSVTIEDVLFIGATLWTDLNDWDELTMRMAYKSMTDYRAIRNGLNMYIQPSDTILKFEESKKYIFNTLKENRYKKTVVVTHHLPSYQCVAPRFVGDLLNHCFATELREEILECEPNLWAFGHTHSEYDGVIGNTRLICNPYGYKDVEVNKGYNPILTIEV